MSVAELRPLAFGEILDGAFTLYRRHFVPFVATAMIGLVPVSALSGVSMANPGTFDPQAPIGPEAIWILPLFLLSSVGFLLVWAALTHQIAAGYGGDDVSVRDGVSRAGRVFFRLAAAITFAYLAAVLVVLALAVAGGAVSALFVARAGRGLSGIVVPIVTALVFIIVLVILATGMFAVVQAVVLEGAGPVRALLRSWRLSRGARLKIFAVMTVTWLITVMPLFALMMLAGVGLAYFDPVAAATLSTADIIIQQTVSFVIGAATFPFFATVLVLLYYDRRIRTDAYDLEVATERLAAAT